MTRFSEFMALCRALETSPRRLEKLRLVAEFLRSIDAGEVTSAVAYLTGRPFPASDSRVLNVRGLPSNGPAAVASSLTIADVAEAFGTVADASGAGSRRVREERLAALAARDHADSTRAVAPLRPAADAVNLDTTAMGFAEQVRFIVDLARPIFQRG